MKFLVFAYVIFISIIQKIYAKELVVHILTLTEISACFYDEDSVTTKRGICVQSTPSSVNIKNLKDEVIVSHERNSSHGSLQLGEHKFIKSEGVNKFHRLISRGTLEDGLDIVDADKKDLEKAARSILEDQHIDLLEKTARALASKGVYGHEYQSVLPFYSVAKRYTGLAEDVKRKRRRKRAIWKQINGDSVEANNDDLYVDTVNDIVDPYFDPKEAEIIQNSVAAEGAQDTNLPRSQKSQNFDEFWAQAQDSKPLKSEDADKLDTKESQNADFADGPSSINKNSTKGNLTINSSWLSCPPNPDDFCLGLCGYGCNCWKFICGDCCLHIGCYQHDRCCRKSMWSWSCLTPFGFKCDSNFDPYPECLSD